MLHAFAAQSLSSPIVCRKSMKIQIVTPYAVNVSEKTNWFFIKIETDDGLAGWGEASLSGGWEENQMLNCKRLAEMIVGKAIDEALPLLTVFPHAVGGLVWNSILSAAEMALMDIKARAAGVVYSLAWGDQPALGSGRATVGTPSALSSASSARGRILMQKMP